MACSTLSGRRYSQAEVKGLLAQAGWPANLIETMSAIIMAESSGYACARNQCGENSVGLAQVNLNAHRQYTVEQMCDPIQNLIAAYRIYRERGNFRPWGAYTNGSYRRYLNSGGPPVSPPAGGQPAGYANNQPSQTTGAAALPLIGLVLLFLILDG